MTSYALLAGLLLLAPADGADKSDAIGKRYFEVLAGQWDGAMGLTADWPGVGKQGDVIPAVGTESPILGGRAVECDVRFGPVRGKILRVWDPASRSVRSLGISAQGQVYRQTLVPDGAAWAGKDSCRGGHSQWTCDSVRSFTKSGQLQTIISTNRVENGKSVPDSWEVYRRGPLPKMPREAFQALDDLVGEWQYEGTIGTKPVRGTFTYAWAPGQSALTFQGTWIDKDGTARGSGVIGWDPARKQIVSRDHWTAGWSNSLTLQPKGPTLLEGQGDTPNADGRPATTRVSWEFPEPGRYVYRWTDRIGKDGQPDAGMTLQARKLPPAGGAFQAPQALKDYGKAFVGEWQGQVIPLAGLAGPGAKQPRTPGRCTCRWILDGAALEWTGQVGDGRFHFLVYHDPETGQLRTLGADSGGGLMDEAIAREKEAWVSRTTVTNPDGKQTPLTCTTTFHGPDQHTNDMGTSKDVWTRVKK